MKNNTSRLLLSGLYLLLVFAVIASLTSCLTAQDESAEEGGRFTVLNPESWLVPFNATALSPRLDTLSGKIIGIIGQTHEPMLFVEDALKKAVPDIKEVHILEGRWGNRVSREAPTGLTEQQLEEIAEIQIDAVIQGIAH